jgi:hypothetical protein
MILGRLQETGRIQHASFWTRATPPLVDSATSGRPSSGTVSQTSMSGNRAFDISMIGDDEDDLTAPSLHELMVDLQNVVSTGRYCVIGYFEHASLERIDC